MQKKRVSIWFAIIIAMVLISLLILNSQNNILNASTGATVTTVPESSDVEKKEEIELSEFSDSKYAYSIGVPPNWTHVTMDGCDTFVHSPTATSLQIRIADYFPELLLVTGESIQAEIASSGYTIRSFDWIDNTKYTVVYAENKENNPCIYAEATYFDQKNMIRLKFTWEDKYSDAMLPTIEKILDSFKWKPKEPFPEGMSAYYSRIGKYVFVYPSDWNTGSSGNTYAAQDPETGTLMSVSATESTASYKELTKNDYVKFASNGRSGFLLQTYNASENVIYAQSSYIVNNTNMILIQYLMATGTHEYALTFEVPQIYLESKRDVIQNMINGFRFY